MDNKITLGVVGANGKMGAILTKLASERYKDDFNLLATANGPQLGGIEDLVKKNPTVIVDFSHRNMTEFLLNELLKSGFSGTVIICTTDISHLKHKALKLSEFAKVVMLSNTSLGAIVMRELVRQASSALSFAEVEIIETHHNQKEDSPSGTALALGKVVAMERKLNLDIVAKMGRCGRGKRSKEEIGFAAVRGGNIAGEHEVRFFLEEEYISIFHNASCRGVFAEGALKIAKIVATSANYANKFITDETVYQDLFKKCLNYKS